MKAAFHAAIMAKSPNAYWHRMENGERMVKPAHYLAWALSMNFNPPQELINEVHLVVKKVWPQSEQSAPQASVEDLQKRIAELEKQLTDAATITLDKHNSIKRNVILPYMLDLFLKANNYSTKSAAAQAFIEKYGANPKTHKLVLDLQKKDNSVMDVASLLRMCRAQ
ncbi:MAG: hypothetical protein EBQ80_01975 [Proteobacteria bacterium]|nr:hypothetical protein [Pseudomonadota bacterium]